MSKWEIPGSIDKNGVIDQAFLLVFVVHMHAHG